MNALTKELKEVRALAKRLADHDKIIIQGSCFYHALAAKIILNADIQAGTMSWKLTSIDTGANPTHFSYVFEPQKLPFYMMRNLMPELHIWNVHQDKVLDLTTCYLPKQAKKLMGYDWQENLLPPEYHFGEAEDKKHKFLYLNHPLAQQMVNKWMVDKIREINLTWNSGT